MLTWESGSTLSKLVNLEKFKFGKCYRKVKATGGKLTTSLTEWRLLYKHKVASIALPVRLRHGNESWIFCFHILILPANDVRITTMFELTSCVPGLGWEQRIRNHRLVGSKSMGWRLWPRAFIVFIYGGGHSIRIFILTDNNEWGGGGHPNKEFSAVIHK